LKPGQACPMNDCLQVLRDLCEALSTAHEEHIVHCDIKPSNVFYHKNKGIWKLGDFGLSSLIEGEQAERTGGTWEYMPPEVREGNKPTVKSDVYSLGVLMREMLTGKTTGDLSQVRTTYKELDGDWLRELVALVDRMTTRNPLDRPSLSEAYRFVRRSGSL